jgi:signal transduction histidine kinase
MNAIWNSILRRPLERGCWEDTWYLVVTLLTGVFAFAFVVATGMVSLSLVLIGVGFLLAAAAARGNRRWCNLERRRAGRILGRPIVGRYAPPAGGSYLGRWTGVLGDRQTKRDALWLLMATPLAALGATLALTAWTAVGALLTAPIYEWSLPGWIHSNVVWISIVEPLLSPLAAVAAAWLIHGGAVARARLAEQMLSPGRNEALAERVQELSESRAGAVDAAVTELQRVERDLHDGAQARLVALAMDLGVAEQRLAQSNPEAAREHLASARGQARAAMADLRDLVRGIGPSILTDRGLDAALTALVSGRNPPVDLWVKLPGPDGRGSDAGGSDAGGSDAGGSGAGGSDAGWSDAGGSDAGGSDAGWSDAGGQVGARETAAYFVVAEALTNARKHARASRIEVRVWEDGDRRLITSVTDDGIGGADPEAGSGLAGLRKRVAALDGTLTVSSPAGGPTAVRAELPCAS